MLRTYGLSILVVLATAASARADGLPAPTLGYYLQPQFKLRQNSDVQGDEDGFVLRRTRLLIGAERPAGCLKLELGAELEVAPDFVAQDAWIALSGQLQLDGAWSARVGQFKAPFSRQALLSDSRLQLVEKAAIAGLAPDRQVGLGATLVVPGAPWLEVSLGVFNGEGKNVIANVDENFMYVGRVGVRPIGRDAPLAEGAFGPTQVAVAGSFAYNVRDQGDYDQTRTYLGGDLFGSWNGLSGTVEYTWVKTDYDAGAPETPSNANGLALQAGYLLPLPGALDRHFEIAARFEEIDRNDTVPIQQPGNDEQSLRLYTAGASYYHDGHALKLQLQASHVVELEDQTGTGVDATFDNDTVLLQVTVRQ